MIDYLYLEKVIDCLYLEKVIDCLYLEKRALDLDALVISSRIQEAKLLVRSGNSESRLCGSSAGQTPYCEDTGRGVQHSLAGCEEIVRMAPGALMKVIRC